MSRFKGGSSERYTSGGRLQRAAAVVRESDFRIAKHSVIERSRSAIRRLAAFHSITSSAVASSVGGIVSISAFAVLRLMSNSNLTGACMGSSAAFAPLRMRST